MRFEDEDGSWIDFTADFPSNHNGTIKKHGAWAFPSTSRAMASRASAVALLGDPLGLGMAYLYTNETIVKELH